MLSDHIQKLRRTKLEEDLYESTKFKEIAAKTAVSLDSAVVVVVAVEESKAKVK